MHSFPSQLIFISQHLCLCLCLLLVKLPLIFCPFLLLLLHNVSLDSLKMSFLRIQFSDTRLFLLSHYFKHLFVVRRAVDFLEGFRAPL
nr:hypothetical protein Iba_chr05fCG1930 [Ipomoea batatas]